MAFLKLHQAAVKFMINQVFLGRGTTKKIMFTTSPYRAPALQYLANREMCLKTLTSVHCFKDEHDAWTGASVQYCSLFIHSECIVWDASFIFLQI